MKGSVLKRLEDLEAKESGGNFTNHIEIIGVESPWRENTDESWARFLNFQQEQKDKLIDKYGADSPHVLDHRMYERPQASYDLGPQEEPETIISNGQSLS